jgi:large subunit ribosomal protein L7/L12
MAEKANKVEKIVESVAELSVLELSELVNALQEKLGVSAMAMAAPAVAPSGSGEATPAADAAAGGGTVIMTAAGANKIAVIKALREINPNWGLKEAKDMTEALPATILTDAKPDDAKSAVEKLKTAGATIETK